MSLNIAIKSLDIDAAIQYLSVATHDSDHVDKLVDAYVAASNAEPTRTSEFTVFLRSLTTSGRLPSITIPNYAGTGTDVQEKLDDMLVRALFEKIRRLLNDEEHNSEIVPENPYLVAALVSGSCMGMTLCTCSDQDGSIDEGLQITPYDEDLEKEEMELRAVHACLQVLLAGSEYPRAAKVAGAIQKLKEKGVVASENGRRLLDATLTHAQENQAKLSSAEAWGILFP